jgi:hypothetical protein
VRPQRLVAERGFGHSAKYRTLVHDSELDAAICGDTLSLRLGFSA